MEQVLDWLNENEVRAYPLLGDASKNVTALTWNYSLPDNFLLDLQLLSTVSLTVVDPQLGPLPAPVSLSGLLYASGDLTVTFSAAENIITTFVVVNAAHAIYPYYVRNADGCLAVFGAGTQTLVTSGIPVDQLVVVDISTEPTVCVQFNDTWLGVSGISVSPEKKTVAPGYAPRLPIEPNPTVSKLTGDVKFLEGYNFRVNIANNLIDLEISSSYGLIMNCSTSFLPARYLDCSELVSYINGVPPDTHGKFTLNPGNNINIPTGDVLSAFADPLEESANTHSLFVGLTFQSTDLCAPVNITPSIT